MPLKCNVGMSFTIIELNWTDWLTECDLIRSYLKLFAYHSLCVSKLQRNKEKRQHNPNEDIMPGYYMVKI